MKGRELGRRQKGERKDGKEKRDNDEKGKSRMEERKSIK